MSKLGRIIFTSSIVSAVLATGCAQPLDGKRYRGTLDCDGLEDVELALTFDGTERGEYEGDGLIEQDGFRLDFLLEAEDDAELGADEIDVEIDASDCGTNRADVDFPNECVRFDNVVVDTRRDEISGELEINPGDLVCSFNLR